MRTLHFDTELAWRGGQQQVLLLVAGLVRRGVQAQLAAPAGSALAARAREAGIEVTPLSARNDADPLAAFRLARLLRRQPAEILHCHTARAHAIGLLARRLLPNSRRPMVVVSRRVAFTALSALTRSKFAGANRVIAVSQAVRQRLVSAGVPAGRISVVHDGIPLDRPAPAPADRERVRHFLRLKPSDFLVAHVAHLGAEKGQSDLIAAAPRVFAELPSAVIAIVGAGNRRAHLERKAAAVGAARILFIGFWPPEDVPALLSAADVFVFPSRKEGLGSALLEAMAVGTPVVATSTGGIPELVRDGVTGLLVPPRDPPALAAAILRLLRDPALRSQLSSAAAEFVRDRGSAERMVEETIAVYRAMFSSAN